MSNEIEKLYSEDVEKNVLGCMLVFNENHRYIKKLEEEDFVIAIHRTIFKLIQELDKEEKPIEILSVKEKAKNNNLNEKEIFNYLINITSNLITSSTFEFYLKKLKNYSVRRKIIKKSRELMQSMYEFNSEENAEEIKKNAINTITDIKIDDIDTSSDDMNEVMTESFKDIENKYANRNDNKYKTGFFELDKVTDGLHEQEFTIIAARPGLGKTSIALNIAENISKKGVITYFCSLEMSKKQLGNRLISSRTNIDSHRIRSGWLESEDFQKIVIAMDELSKLKLLIDTQSKTVQDIEIKAYELKEKQNIGLIIIDYLQLLKSKNKFNIREQEVAEISRKLKLLSRDLNIPVIALCQLNRESLKRTRPTNADLRESGSLEQDADNIIFIYADDEEREKKVVETEIIVSKQRNGPTGTIKLKYDKKTMTFRNLC